MRARATRTILTRSRPHCVGTSIIRKNAVRWVARGGTRSEKPGTMKPCSPMCWRKLKVGQRDFGKLIGEIISAMKLLIIGFSQPGHMGNYLVCAARQLGLDYQIIDASGA